MESVYIFLPGYTVATHSYVTGIARRTSVCLVRRPKVGCQIAAPADLITADPLTEARPQA